MAPEVRLARVVIPGTQRTRDPAEGAESRAIVEYVQRFALEVGGAPIAVHEVPGVGDVWFMLPPPNKCPDCGADRSTPIAGPLSSPVDCLTCGRNAPKV